ncbi:hypothetical protein [Streptomyces coelicolor A3(2)]|uniref:Uncharacterized protein n=1 Tax=Streptomyces coelicolor (strain ATCC BAA-471 / A3(2) / M145) TaxID=100226 RepID=Q9X8Q2_STRCO|nr:hypothetical protein [Streptomyces coelicolor A3(2)]
MPLRAVRGPPQPYGAHDARRRHQAPATRHRVSLHAHEDAVAPAPVSPRGRGHALRVGRLVQEGHAVAGESVHVVQVVPRPGGPDRAEVPLDRPRVVDDQHLRRGGERLEGVGDRPGAEDVGAGPGVVDLARVE